MDHAVSSPFPAHLTTSWPLGLAHSITLRPIRPEDFDLEIELARSLSRHSLYNRFLGGGVRLTRALLRKLTCIDFSRDMALIATGTLESTETAIGVVRYARLEDSAACEFAIAVADVWQRCGVGKKLVATLIDCARAHGLRTMIGEVLAANTPMLRLARSQGFRIDRHPDGGELRRLSLDLLP